MLNPALVIIPLFTAFIASCYGFGMYLFATMVPDMRGDLAYDTTSVGLISALTQAGVMIGGLIVGPVLHRLGAARMLILTMGLTAVCLALTGLISGTVQLAVLTTILGLCAAFIWVPMTPYVQSHIPTRQHGLALGIMGGGTSYGVFLNGLLIPPVIEHYDWRMVWFLAAAVTLALGLIGWWAMRHIQPIAAQAPSDKAKARVLDILQDRSAVVAIAMTFLIGLAILPFETYLTSFFRDQHGWSMAAAAGLWSAVGIGGMIGGIGFGLLADRIGAKPTLFIANGVLALGCIITWVSANELAVYPAMFLFGMAYNGIFGLIAAYVARTMAANAGGTVIGLTYIALGLGSLIGNYSGGLLAGASGGYGLLYGLVGALTVLNVVLTFGLKGERG